MDQAAREGRPPVTAAGESPQQPTVTPAAAESEQKSPEELRDEIEQTREQLGDTVEALAAKTDVKAQARDRIAAVKSSAQRKKDELMTKARRATPHSPGAGAQQVATTVQTKPAPFAAGGAFAAGLFVGWLLGRR
jgi:chromosome segregation ATPase